MVVPQIGQVPFVAGFPFFMVICVGFFISTFFLSLRQYPSTSITSLSSCQVFHQRSRTGRIVSVHLAQFNHVRAEDMRADARLALDTRLRSGARSRYPSEAWGHAPSLLGPA